MPLRSHNPQVLHHLKSWQFVQLLVQDEQQKGNITAPVWEKYISGKWILSNSESVSKS